VDGRSHAEGLSGFRGKPPVLWGLPSGACNSPPIVVQQDALHLLQSPSTLQVDGPHIRKYCEADAHKILR